MTRGPARIRRFAIAAGAAAVVVASAPVALAYPFGPGETRVVPDAGMYVQGVRVRGASAVIRVTTDRPLFHGVAIPDVRLSLSTTAGTEIGATRADPSGAWAVGSPRLPPGRHVLQLDMQDDTGVSTGPQRVATFEIPRRVPVGTTASRAPPLSLRRWNDVTVSMLVFGVAGVLLAVYMTLRRRADVPEA